MKSTSVTRLRAKAVAYLQGKKNVTKSEIREHLGLPSGYHPMLDKALKTVKIRVIKARPQIAQIDGKPLYLATPISFYSPAS